MPQEAMHFRLLYYQWLAFNTYNAAGVSRRQVKNFTKLAKKCQILEFRDYIWNHRKKCIKICTNMPSIGLLIGEIGFRI